MSAGVKYSAFLTSLAEGVHNFSTHVFKVALTDRAPVDATDALFVDISEIAAGNGYTAGGNVAVFSSVSGSGPVGVFLANPASFVASGGSIGPFRYAVLYNDTVTDKPLVGYWDIGAETTIVDAAYITIVLDQTNGTVVLQ